MSGPNPPGWEPEEPDAAGELRHGRQSVSEPGEELAPTEIDSHDELEPHDDSSEIAAADHTGQTDAYSQAYSAPESEHFMTGPYVPADLRLYDYDGYDDSADADDEHRAPRWPWVVGVAAIVAAIALVVSVSLLVTGTDTSKLAAPGATTTTAASTASGPPVQDEITTTTPPPPPPPPSTQPPTATETQTVTVTPPPPPPPPPAPPPAPPATTTAAPPPAPT